MLIQRIANVNNPTSVSDASVLVAVKNSYSTASLAVGTPVAWDYTTDADGVGVIMPTTALLRAAAGIVTREAIASGEYGLVQCYGHNTEASCAAAATAAGDALGVSNGATRLSRITATVAVASLSPFFVAGYATSTTTGTLSNRTVFIRCM